MKKVEGQLGKGWARFRKGGSPRLPGPPDRVSTGCWGQRAELNSPRSSGIRGMRGRKGCLDHGRGAEAASSLLRGPGETPAQAQGALGSHVPSWGPSGCGSDDL